MVNLVAGQDRRSLIVTAVRTPNGFYKAPGIDPSSGPTPSTGQGGPARTQGLRRTRVVEAPPPFGPTGESVPGSALLQLLGNVQFCSLLNDPTPHRGYPLSSTR